MTYYKMLKKSNFRRGLNTLQCRTRDLVTEMLPQDPFGCLACHKEDAILAVHTQARATLQALVLSR